MAILLLFSFLSGLVTIFAPCIWPLLPIILSSSTGGVKKPLGITSGIMLSFGFFTLFTSYLVRIIPFDPNVLRYIAVFVITVLGFSLIIPGFSAWLEIQVSKISGKFGIGSGNKGSGFTAGLVTGLSLGILWTPCAGPILATIATLAATREVSGNVVLVLAVYILGVGIPLFMFSLLGNIFFDKSRLLTKYTGKVQRVFGFIMILTAVAILTNYDKTLQAKLLDAFPSYGNFVVNLENNKSVNIQLSKLQGENPDVNKQKEGEMFDPSGRQNMQYFNKNYQAPDFLGISKWLNTDKGYSIDDLKGKVVLVDFWTYTCINCIRTLPYVTGWYDKYKNQGFMVIGVHTPEFEFEKNSQNVLDAIKQYGIHYPVAQDNDYATWQNYSNHYWPAEYLIDARGRVRRTHFGEGEYDRMEEAIRVLLEEAGKKINTSLENIKDQTPTVRLSPETYLGTDRAEYYYPDGTVSGGKNTYTLNGNPPVNSVSLGGSWNIQGEYAKAEKNADLAYTFYAGKVFLVMRPGGSESTEVKVYLDGKIISAGSAGADVRKGTVKVDRDRLYTLVDLRGRVEKHTLKLEFTDSNTEVFAFTFGQ